MADSKNDLGALWYSKNTDLFCECPESHGEGQWVAPPHTICLQVSRHCNFRCAVCISDSSPEQASFTDWLKFALHQISKEFGPIRIVWSGGEPTLTARLAEYLEVSRALGNANILATNASRFVEHLAADWVDISLYGASPESFRQYTGVRCFRKVMNNIARYVSSYPKVSASFVLGVHGASELRAMADLVIGAGVRRLKFHRLSMAGRNDRAVCGDAADSEAHEMHRYLIDRDIVTTFTRTRSSEQKQKGYWVAIPPGVLTNSGTSVDLADLAGMRAAVLNNLATSRSLFSSSRGEE